MSYFSYLLLYNKPPQNSDFFKKLYVLSWFCGLPRSPGTALQPHMTLAGTAVILGHNCAGSPRVAHSCVWHLDGVSGRLAQLRQLGLSLSTWPQALPPRGLSTWSLQQNIQTSSMLVQGSPKCRSGSCQDFLRLKPRTATSATFCRRKERTWVSPDSVWESVHSTKTWIWGSVVR